MFSHLTDPAKVPEWQESLVELEQESDGPIDRGTSLREVRTFLGRRVESRLEVTAFERDRRFDLRTVSGPVPFSVSHVLEPVGSGTRLHVTAEAKPGRLFLLAGAVVMRQAERQLRADFATLKRLVERD